MSELSPVGRLIAIREAAAGRGDWNLVAETELELGRLDAGWSSGPVPGGMESTVDTTVYEAVVPRRPRGRPRKVV